MLEKLVERFTTLNAERSSLITEGMEIFEKSLITLLRRYPIIQEIWWTQYTPHFNDGSPCTFGIGYLYVKIGDINYQLSDYDDKMTAEEYDNDDLDEETWAKRLTPEELQEQYPQMVKELTDLQEALQILKDVVYERFGDHQKVIANRDGITTEDYEHD